jgi:hypothetical protein
MEDVRDVLSSISTMGDGLSKILDMMVQDLEGHNNKELDVIVKRMEDADV